MSFAYRRRSIWSLLLLLLAGTFLVVEAGRLLVVNAPQSSDLIIVLAGETDRRPALALDLLQNGYAPRILLDVPADAKIYNTTALQIAENYIRDLPNPAVITICPIAGLSTRAETQDVVKCLARGNPAKKILLVTSDYHTRRALSIFRHEIHGSDFSVAAAHDSTQFGTRWWTHRQWAKTCVDEWLRLLWWSAVERWY